MTDDPAKLHLVIKMGIGMRAKQKQYFKTRDRSDLSRGSGEAVTPPPSNPSGGK